MSHKPNGDSVQIVLELKNAAGSWLALERELGVNRGLLWKHAHGVIDSPTVLDALGMPRRVTITLDNVHDLEIAPEALSYFLRSAKKLLCQVCGEFYYRVGNQKYCHDHSWASLEGRRYWRSVKKAA